MLGETWPGDNSNKDKDAVKELIEAENFTTLHKAPLVHAAMTFLSGWLSFPERFLEGIGDPELNLKRLKPLIQLPLSVTLQTCK